MDYRAGYSKNSNEVLDMIGPDLVARAAYGEICRRVRWSMPGKVNTERGVVDLDVGQGYLGRQRFAATIGATERQTRTALARLVALGVVSLKTSKSGTVVTLIGANGSDAIVTTERPTAVQQTSNSRLASDQQPPTKKTKTKTKTIDPTARRLASGLADLIVANNPQHRLALGTEDYRETTVAAWAIDIERLHRRGHVPHEQIEAVIVWSQADEFWRANILSGKKLREKYDQLAAKMGAERARRPALRAVNRCEPQPAAAYVEQTL
jgi:hypothetical protein